MTTVKAPRQRRAVQPRALIVSVYGLYARDAGGWLSVAALIRLLAEVGVDAPAVRSSISRLKRRGILKAARQESVAGYGLSERARQILGEGDRRIFARPVVRAEDGWLLAVFSVPESQRARRHTLRSQLSGLGFGNAAAGVWIAPAQLYEETRATLERLELSPYVDLFRADYLAFADPHVCVASWWDLGVIDASYAAFIASFRPVLRRWSRRRSDDDAAAFADFLPALTYWRRLPYLDPGLPAELLPGRWSGARAAELFTALNHRLAPAARRYVAEVTAAVR